MQSFMYSAWFRNHNLKQDDQDYEWVAMFIIDAESSAAAQKWGDHLSLAFCRRRTNEGFIRSTIESPSEYANCVGFESTPRTAIGTEPSDELIGW
jgi:hypothetical protein